MEKTRIYPLSKQDNPPKMVFPNGTGKPADMLYPKDYRYFEGLAEFINNETVDAEDAVLVGHRRDRRTPRAGVVHTVRADAVGHAHGAHERPRHGGALEVHDLSAEPLARGERQLDVVALLSRRDAHAPGRRAPPADESSMLRCRS